MQTYLLPLPASPETGEELTAFARKIFLRFRERKKFCPFSHPVNSDLHFLRAFSTLREIFLFAFREQTNVLAVKAPFGVWGWFGGRCVLIRHFHTICVQNCVTF
jgi:hypothetical protein